MVGLWFVCRWMGKVGNGEKGERRSGQPLVGLLCSSLTRLRENAGK